MKISKLNLNSSLNNYKKNLNNRFNIKLYIEMTYLNILLLLRSCWPSRSY